MCVVETAGAVGREGDDVPLAEGVIERPGDVVGQALRAHLVIDGVLAAERGVALEMLAHLGCTVVQLISWTADVLRSFPDIEIDPRDLRLAHAVGPQQAGAEPLWMMDQDVQRRPLEGNAGLLEPDTHLRKNVVDEALVAGAVDQPVDDGVAAGTDRIIIVWRRGHILSLGGGVHRDISCCGPTASTLPTARIVRTRSSG